MRLFFREFSTPGGVPSHCGPHLPNSIHEGGELGYALLHAFGAAFDNPDLIVACVVGDGEAETCPLEGSWKSNRFLNPARDGAVLPILHLNGYKISGPTVEARTDRRGTRQALSGPRIQAVFRRRRRSAVDAPEIRRRARRLLRRNSRDSNRRAQRMASLKRPDLANDRSAFAKRLDWPEGSRWNSHRRHLPRAPGASRDRSRKSASICKCSKPG